MDSYLVGYLYRVELLACRLLDSCTGTCTNTIITGDYLCQIVISTKHQGNIQLNHPCMPSQGLDLFSEKNWMFSWCKT